MTDTTAPALRRLRLADAAIAGVEPGGLGAQFKAGFLHLHFHADTIVRLQVHQNPVGLELLDLGFAKQLLRRVFEADRHHGVALLHALAGAQVERHIAPAPVIDEQFQRRVGFRHTVLRHARLI